MNRIAKAFVAVLMWIYFSTGLILMIVLQALGIVAWLFTGNKKIEEWVKVTGKASDQCNNAAFYHGHPKETISSHAGRWYRAYINNEVEEYLVPDWVFMVDRITDIFERDHVLKAIEKPFEDQPLDRP